MSAATFSAVGGVSVVHSSEGYHASAVLPSTWRAVQLSTWHARFDDTAHSRMIRIDTSYNGNLGTVTALNQKIKSLKGTLGLHHRWVATRYVGWSGRNAADVDFSAAGSPTDSKLLGTAINMASISLTLAG